MSIRLGMDMKLYYVTGGGPLITTVPLTTWVEIPNVRDLTLNTEKGEADVTTRGNGGWRAMVGTLKEGGADFQMVYDTADTGFDAIKDAFMNNTAIGLAIMDGNIATPGSEGLIGNFSVTKFNIPQPLEDATKVDVTVRLTYSAIDPTWYTVPA